MAMKDDILFSEEKHSKLLPLRRLQRMRGYAI
jgi:hypothetical protein